MKKIFSIMLCAIIALLPMSISASAVNKATTVSALKGLEVDMVKGEDDNAVIFAKNGNENELTVVKTADGKNYSKTVIDFKKYVENPNGEYENWYIEYQYDYADGIFVAFVYSHIWYDIFSDKEERILLVTDDFKNFKKYNTPTDVDSNSKVLITKSECLIYYGSDIYATKDYKNFTKYNTPSYNYKTVGNGIIAFDKRVDGFCDGYDPVYLYSEMYYTEDLKNYTKIWKSANSEQTDCPIVVSVDNNTKELYIFDFQNRGNKDGKLVINAVNKTSGKSREIFSVDFAYPSNKRDYFNAFTDGDNYFDIYLLNKDESKEMYTVNLNTEKVTKGTCNYSFRENLLFKDLGDNALFLDDKNVYVIDYANPQSAQIIDVSKSNITGSSSADYYCFKIKNSAFILYTEFSETRVLEIPIESQNKVGDINGDSAINSADALKVLQFSVGSITFDEKAKAAADVTKDGKINSADALKILQYSVGKITSF